MTALPRCCLQGRDAAIGAGLAGFLRHGHMLKH